MPRTSSPRRAHQAFPHLARDSTSARPALKDVARLIRDGQANRIIIMAGAGISTGAGIPDFRSPGTGLYDNLAKYDLPYPEAIFDIEYLEERPEAFYTLAKELYPGNFKPTATHYFFKLLQDKGLLSGVWTQNIDTLERIAGVKEEYIIEAHGSFEAATCLRCSTPYTKESIKPEIMKGNVVRCSQQKCKGKQDALVKPNIVFFGEGLPDKFFDRLADFETCDLLIIMGTSLTVGPFNSLISRVPNSCPRLLINLERVGEDLPDGFEFDRQGKQARDLFWKGHSDAGIEELCKLVGQGWQDELDQLRREGWEALGQDQPSGCEAEGKSDKQPSKNASDEQSTETESEEGKEVANEVERAVKDSKDAVDELVSRVERVELDSSAETEP
ncbi:SIR2 family NAD-dependent protein deacylase [Sporobolomyces koalae]|uniref:SIR2 family NAD-dependent protein deacylase n=1 Tax=Sporobolomyces koalae TaxID=500713 RepID=UPI0031799076